MTALEILGVIYSRKAFLTLSLMMLVSLVSIDPILVAEEFDCSNTLAVSHTSHFSFDEDGNYVIRGIVYIKNTGSSPAYILGVSEYIQSEHSPQWITIKEEALLEQTDMEGALVIQPGKYEKIVFVTAFIPEVGNYSYRNRIEVLVLDPEGTSTKYLSDTYFTLPEGPPPTTVPPTTVPPTTQPPTTVPPTTEPPTTEPPTTEPPTTSPPTTVPTLPPIDIGNGSISNIEADICHGGTAVCVELTVSSGSFTQSSLQLVVTSQDEDSWKKIYEDCIDIYVGGEGMTTDNTPVIFCFEDILLRENVESYNICVTWKQGLTCKRNAPVISRQCTGCHNIPTLDYLTYGVIIATLLFIGAVVLRKVSKE